MGAYVASQLIKALLKKRIQVNGAKILIMGLTFKENCPDLRNTRIVDIIKELAEYNIEMDIFDPWVDPTEASHEYGLSVISQRPVEKYDGVIIAVAHQQFQSMSQEEYRALTKEESIIYDLKYVLSSDFADIRL